VARRLAATRRLRAVRSTPQRAAGKQRLPGGVHVTKRPPVLRLHLGDEIVADNFAGGGGASTGIAAAIGRAPDVAINHDPEAIALHRANHPETEHHVTDVWEVDPRVACKGRPVALAWFSPDCKHHSKAKGGKPRNQKIRALAWVAVRWAAAVKPRVIALENVEEFADWGPLLPDGKPCPRRKGKTFRAFVRRLERLGYVVEWRLLRACDFGAPTSRRRLFLVARCDGRRVVWPAATHGPGRARAYRTAAECIDWSLPCPSVFDRKKPLADATMRRIARGVQKFVLEAAQPFIAPVTHQGDARVHAVTDPLRTITGANRGELALVVPYLVHRSNGERPGQAPRIYDAQRPLGTIVAQGQKHALCTAFLARHYGERATGGWAGGAALDRPIPTITTRDHHALVAALLVRYNGTSNAETLDRPLGTLTCRDRYGLVTVRIDGDDWTIVDIGMRMLTPRELYLAQGFPPDYEIAPIGPKGKPLSKTAQVRMVGNSVSPPMAEAVVRANHPAAAHAATEAA
jgi:DNA (cytosine-5)-methyltransferase 1